MNTKRLYLTLTTIILLLMLFACNEPKRKCFEVIPETPPEQTQTISKKRVALIIGNADYKFAPLNNPVNDAEDMKTSLSKLGFDVIFLKNASYESMEIGIKKFKKKLGDDKIGLFYFSGRGVQYEGMNYMIPTDISDPTISEIKFRSIPIEYVLSNMEEANNQVNIIILDACSNNPFKNGTKNVVRKGLAQITAPSGSLIAYATSPGEVAEDGVGRNSPYTKYLKKFILEPNLPIEIVFKKVRKAVMQETKKRQTPWESSSLYGDDIYLAKTIDEKDRRRRQQEQIQEEQTVSSCKNCNCEQIRRIKSMGFSNLTPQQQEFKKTCPI